MRPTLLAAAFGAALIPAALPAQAQDDLGKVVTGVAQALLQQEIDKAAFAEAQRVGTAAAYRDYLARFPRGIYAGNAQQALTKLSPNRPAAAQPATPSAAQTEADLNLTRSQRVTIQRQLTQLGYDTRGADGLWGSGTRGALTRWQQANGQAGTGYITRAQVNRIAEQAAAKPAVAPAPAQGDADLEEKLLSLSAAERREAQLRLTLLGYDTRGTNGTFGDGTRSAIRRWQGDHGLRATGFLTADQIATLRAETKG